MPPLQILHCASAPDSVRHGDFSAFCFHATDSAGAFLVILEVALGGLSGQDPDLVLSLEADGVAHLLIADFTH